MGDTGSLFLGFTLSLITVEVSQKGTSMVAMLAPVLAIGLPIIDTMFAILRRAWRGQHLFLADRDHIHHRLMQKGLSHRNTVLVMYAFAASLATLSLITALKRDLTAGLALAGAVIIVGILVRKVGYAQAVLPRLTQLLDSARKAEENRALNRKIREVSNKVNDATNAKSVIDVLGELVNVLGAEHAVLVINDEQSKVFNFNFFS